MKQSETIKLACQVLRRKVRFKDAGFTLPGNEFTTNDTPAIQEATRLYVETWIVPILDMIEQGNIRGLSESLRFERKDPMESKT